MSTYKVHLRRVEAGNGKDDVLGDGAGRLVSVHRPGHLWNCEHWHKVQVQVTRCTDPVTRGIVNISRGFAHVGRGENANFSISYLDVCIPM